MRLFILIFFFSGLVGCAGPHLVEQQFPQEKTLHISKVGAVADTMVLSEYVFYLDEGDIIPLNVRVDCSFIDFAKDKVDLVMKKRIYFRISLAENATQEDLNTFINMTPEKMANLKPEELKNMSEKIELYLGTDGHTWAMIRDMAGIKEVLGLDGGTFSLGLALSNEEGIWALFSLALKERLDA